MGCNNLYVRISHFGFCDNYDDTYGGETGSLVGESFQFFSCLIRPTNALFSFQGRTLFDTAVPMVALVGASIGFFFWSFS
jgi:hypothetical protein